ncbi:MAG: phosphate transport system regulatory protein PhoU [Bacteroidetes bacterium]|nr:MAG: phosphate transport system regulatory protein PhoU [Bacteroidota bacterium]
MTHLEEELKSLKKSVLEMTALAISQLKKAKDAYMNMDTEIAQVVIHNEKRMNAIELSIDRDCENIFALFNPVASDLRFVIAMLKINSDLERIADYAEGIASYVVDFDQDLRAELIEATKLNLMFDIAISMAQDIMVAFDEEDDKLAMKVYKKDVELNMINKNSSSVICDFAKKDPDIIVQSLFLFSTIRKLERVGDHIKNIAEELIFYLEAEILKHKKNG